MKLSDLLRDAWFVGPADLHGDAGFDSLLRAVFTRVAADDQVDSDEILELAGAIASGDRGDAVTVGDGVVAVLARVPTLRRTSLGVAVSDVPITVERAGGETVEARVVLAFLTPGKIAGLRQQLLPIVEHVLRTPERIQQLAAARSASDVRALAELMDAEFQPRHIVADALLPARYRVYPDTPMAEVLDLMVRRRIRAVPVVGDRYEVLGILTAGDALGHVVRKGPREGRSNEVADQPLAARDLMSRSILCVSEDQPLSEAANMMVNRGVEQLPVVRDGEFVGFITRDSILGVLHRPHDLHTNERTESSDI